jgi:hypothetical protein
MNRSHHDRQRLKAAIMLKETYDTHQLPRAIHPLPTERWQQIERLKRQVQKSVERGYAVAAQACRQRLNEQIRFCIQELNQYEVQLSQTLRAYTKPSLRMLYEELQALSDDFLEVDVDRVLHELVVCTERIVLDDIELGRFEIRLSLQGTCLPTSFRVIALDPNSSSSDDNVSHPHVQGESLCTSEGTQAINNALIAGRLTDFFLTVRQILRTYNPSSAYVSLDDWNGISCGDCGDMMDSDDSCTCEGCHGSLCDSCSCRCQDCENTLCNECSETCADCDFRFCRGCLKRCETCGCKACQECLENELCPSCLELEMEEDDAESEDTPADQTPPAPTSSETTAQIDTSHAAVQSLCLGEVTVPA